MVVRLERVQRAEVVPFTGGEQQCQRADGSGHPLSRFRCRQYRAGDRSDQRQQDRKFKPGEMQFRDHGAIQWSVVSSQFEI